MLTISQLAKQFGLSRSTLLYYDKIGLLKPSARSESNYRYYSDPDIKKMELICLYRDTGLSLKQIKSILYAKNQSIADKLEDRLLELNREIKALRKQQTHILHLLKKPMMQKKPRILGKSGWVDILKACGMDEKTMWQWHVEFERFSSQAHQDFLVSLNISADEIHSIREKTVRLMEAEKQDS